MAAPKVSEFRWSFSIDVEHVARGLDELRAHLSDFTPVWPELAKRLGRQLAQNVTTSAGKRHAKLSPAYAKRKKREGYAKTPMVRTHELVSELRAGHIVDSEPLSMAVGLEGALAVRAAALNFGTPKRKSNLPAREFFAWTEPMKRTVEKGLNDHIDAGIRRFDGGGRSMERQTSFGRAA